MPGCALHLRAYGTRQRLDRGLKRDDRQRQKREREGPGHRDVSVALRSCSVLFSGRTRTTSQPILARRRGEAPRHEQQLRAGISAHGARENPYGRIGNPSPLAATPLLLSRKAVAIPLLQAPMGEGIRRRLLASAARLVAVPA